MTEKTLTYASTSASGELVGMIVVESITETETTSGEKSTTMETCEETDRADGASSSVRQPPDSRTVNEATPRSSLRLARFCAARVAICDDIQKTQHA
ncbi:hypothetical protein V7S43_011338 [Phytophthora oleae]|uniref:Uncharacterized protein n=1 Tax=Phytophthora oleae TaxID=2107226 RepID=A0ABD3FAY6_9STRA